jgi:hypothetical protein
MGRSVRCYVLSALGTCAAVAMWCIRNEADSAAAQAARETWRFVPHNGHAPLQMPATVIQVLVSPSPAPVSNATHKRLQWWQLRVPKEHVEREHVSFHPNPCLGPPVPLPASFNQSLWYYNTPDVHSTKFWRRYYAHNGECGIKRFHHADTVSCLRNKHVLFVGDSLTRYQYLSLVLFLEFGRWPEQMGGNRSHPGLLWEGEFGSWTDYTVATNVVFNRRERCDCYKGEGPKERSKTITNRDYFNPDLNINVTFIGWFEQLQGHFPLGWLDAPPLSKDSYRYVPPDWQGGIAILPDLMLSAFPQGFDEVVVNTGWWKVPQLSQGNVPLAKRLLHPLQRLLSVKQPGKVPIWATTTLNQHGKGAAPPRDGLLGAPYLAALQLGWRVLDRHGMTVALKRHLQDVGLPLEFGWADQLHFRPFVYEEFNNMLLNILCPY